MIRWPKKMALVVELLVIALIAAVAAFGVCFGIVAGGWVVFDALWRGGWL